MQESEEVVCERRQMIPWVDLLSKSKERFRRLLEVVDREDGLICCKGSVFQIMASLAEQDTYFSIR